jgi:hypothetical protein
MTEKTDQTTPLPPAADADWFLQALVDMANGSDTEFPVTLNVGGMLVSGTLVGGHKYFEGFAKDFFSGWSESTRESAGTLEKWFAELGEIYTADKKADGGNPLASIRFIHLKNARFFQPGVAPIPTNRGVWWRGRLEAVEGFVLGTLAVG